MRKFWSLWCYKHTALSVHLSTLWPQFWKLEFLGWTKVIGWGNASSLSNGPQSCSCSFTSCKSPIIFHFWKGVILTKSWTSSWKRTTQISRGKLVSKILRRLISMWLSLDGGLMIAFDLSSWGQIYLSKLIRFKQGCVGMEANIKAADLVHFSKNFLNSV